ncbi:MAG: citrate/2-methylcitrate synthase [Eubacteriales bacterium]|jgi:citrate synthase
MPYNSSVDKSFLSTICDQYEKYAHIPASAFKNANVKRGLRNADGTGVVAGVTNICNVHGYIVYEGDKVPDEGVLTYRGYNLNDLVGGFVQEGRYGFEETAFLLMFGFLPNRDQLTQFTDLIDKCRPLPDNFTEDMILKAPSRNIMNKLARSVLALYSYDHDPDNTGLEQLMERCILFIARFPTIVAHAYMAKRHYFDRESMHIHYPKEGLSTSETILRTIRPDKQYSQAEAHLLDTALILHAEHGGGNNSTFVARAVASSGTDVYSAIAAAIGSLKGPKHGGANIKVVEMVDHFKQNVQNYEDEEEVAAFIRKVLDKEAGDGSGLIYGMGHAIYTKSDPRAILLKQQAQALAVEKGMDKEFRLLQNIEKMTPVVFQERGNEKAMCANVDLYSGFVYEMLGIPREIFTPLFAIARVAGWSAHVMEEFTTGKKLMRPAYKSAGGFKFYTPLDQR